MILAEIFRALGKCKRGESNFFEGCNLLLQIWPMEHFHQRKNMDDICFSNINHINSFYDRMKEFVYSIGTDDWYEFLVHRTSDQVQWKYPLLPRSPAYIRCRGSYYIELIGLKGLQPYAPVRVLQQFGQAQVIPLRANMRNSEISFGPNFEVPRVREILHEWDNILTIDIGNGPEKKIPEYRVWFQEGRNSISSEGFLPFDLFSQRLISLTTGSGGSSILSRAVNICPFTTLRALGINIGKICESHVRVRGFDGTQRGVIGEIDLPLQIGLMVLSSQGLGAKLDGIVEPIQLPGQKYTFGLGYEPTPEEISSANLKRKSDIPLPQPIPPLNQSFSKAFAAQGLEEAVEDNLTEGLKNLFIEEAECNMILEDCTEASTIWDAMPEDALNNWTCNPSPVLRESW
ncbi:hypothetical protein H5410_037797 [Solanum commersonii]|uniref:Aminotransferase-like plant mobile domain-containing protein n=1 Tax=Solanum commersonii TaxID=4109 RepID=A0A9J5Y8X8_SOLCO|nr:hypothetical protein H5410_037797 [Solanum commersonii]